MSDSLAQGKGVSWQLGQRLAPGLSQLPYFNYPKIRVEFLEAD